MRIKLLSAVIISLPLILSGTPADAGLTGALQKVTDAMDGATSGSTPQRGRQPQQTQPGSQQGGQQQGGQQDGTSVVPRIRTTPPEGTMPTDVSTADKNAEFAPGEALGWTTDENGNTTTLVKYPDGSVKVIKKDKDGNIIQQQKLSKKDAKDILNATNDDTFDVNVLDDGTVMIDQYSSDGSVETTMVDPPAKVLEYTQTDKQSGVTTTTTIKDDGSKSVVRTDKDGNVIDEDHTVGGGSITSGSATDKEGITTTSIRNPDGSRTIIKTDKNGKYVSKEEIPPKGQQLASASATDTNTGITKKIVKNEDGTTTSSTSWTKKDKDGTERTTEVDEHGNQTDTVQTPDGETTVTNKDVYGNTREVKIEEDGSVTTTDRDVYGKETTRRESSDGTTTTVKKDMKGNVTETVEQRRDGSATIKMDNGREIDVGAPDDEGNFIVTKTDKRGNREVLVKDKDGNVIGQKVERETAYEPGEQNFEKNAKGERHWEDLSESEKQRYANREREIKEAKQRKELKKKQEAARKKQEEEDKKWHAEQNKILEEKLAKIRAEQAEADKKILARKEAHELKRKRDEAKEKMKKLDERIQDALARGDKKEAHRLGKEHDKIHDSTMSLFEPTKKEKAEMERKQKVRNKVVDEITGLARRRAKMREQDDWQQGLKEDITSGTKWVSVGSEMQQQTAKTTRMADREKAYAEEKIKIIKEKLADPKTNKDERKVLNDMLDLAGVQKEGAERLLSDNANITTAGYVIDGALLLTGGVGNLAAATGSKVAAKAAATLAAKKAYGAAIAQGLSKGAATRAANAAGRKAAENVVKTAAKMSESKFAEAVGKKTLTQLVTGKAATQAAVKPATTLAGKVAQSQLVKTSAAGAATGGGVDAAIQLATKGEIDLEQTAKAAFAGGSFAGLSSTAARGGKALATAGKGGPKIPPTSASGGASAPKSSSTPKATSPSTPKSTMPTGGSTPKGTSPMTSPPKAPPQTPMPSAPKSTSGGGRTGPGSTQVVNTPKTMPAGGGRTGPGSTQVVNTPKTMPAGGGRTGPGSTQVVNTPKTMPAGGGRPPSGGTPTQIAKAPSGGLPSPTAKTVINPGRPRAGGTQTGGKTVPHQGVKTLPPPSAGGKTMPHQGVKTLPPPSAGGKTVPHQGVKTLPPPKGTSATPSQNLGFPQGKKPSQMTPKERQAYHDHHAQQQFQKKWRDGVPPQDGGPGLLPPPKGATPPPKEGFTKGMAQKDIDNLFKGGVSKNMQGKQGDLLKKIDLIKTGKAPQSKSNMPQPRELPQSHPLYPRPYKDVVPKGGSTTPPPSVKTMPPPGSKTVPPPSAGGKTMPHQGVKTLPPPKSPTGTGNKTVTEGGTTILNPGRGGAPGTGPRGTQVINTPKTMPAGRPPQGGTQVVKGPGGGLPSPTAKTVMNPGRGGAGTGTQVVKGPSGGLPSPGAKTVINPGRPRAGGGTPTQVVKGPSGGLPSPTAKTVMNPGRGGAGRTPTQVTKGPSGGLPSPTAKTVMNPGRGGGRTGPGGTQVMNTPKTTGAKGRPVDGTPTYNPPVGKPKVPKPAVTAKKGAPVAKQVDKLAKLKKPFDAPKGRPEVPRPADGKFLKHPDKTLRRPQMTDVPPKFQAQGPKAQQRANAWENMTKAQRQQYTKEVEGFIKEAARNGDKWAKRYMADMKAGKIKNFYEPRLAENIHGLHSNGVMRLNPIGPNGKLRPPVELGSVALHEGVHSGIGGKLGMNEARAHFAQMSALHRHMKRNPGYQIQNPHIKKMYNDFVKAGQGLPPNKAGFAARRQLEKTFTEGGYGKLYKDNIAKSFSKLSSYKGGNAAKAEADFRKAFNGLTKAEQQQMMKRLNGLNNQGKQTQMNREIENFLQGAQRNAKNKVPPQYPPAPKGAPAVPKAPTPYNPQAKAQPTIEYPKGASAAKPSADPSMTPPSGTPAKPVKMNFTNEKGKPVNIERGKQIGKGKTSKTYEHPTDPKKVVKVRSHEGDFPNAPKMDKFGRKVLEKKVDQDVVRVAKQYESHVVKDAGSAPTNMVGKTVKVVEKVPIAKNQLAKQGGKMSKGQAEAYNKGVKELNKKGYAWLDNHQGNYGFEKVKGTSDQWKLVIADPGGIVPMKGRTPGARAANATEIQKRVNAPSPKFQENNAKFGGTPEKVSKSAANIEREAILKEWGRHIDHRQLGLKNPNEIGFTPAGAFKNQQAQQLSN